MGSSASAFHVRIEVVVTTLSFLWLLAGLTWSPVLGPDYSKRRFATIYVNLAVVGIMCLASLLGSRRYKLPLGAASCLVTLEWVYLAVVSSVV